MKYNIGDLLIEITSEAKMVITGLNVYNVKFLFYLNHNPPVELTWKRREVDKFIEEKLWKHFPVRK